MAKKNVDRLSAWHNGATPLAIGYTICYYGFNEHKQRNWVVTPSSILNNGSRCPNCSGLARITNEEFDRRIKDRNIERVSDVNGVSHNIDFLSAPKMSVDIGGIRLQPSFYKVMAALNVAGAKIIG